MRLPQVRSPAKGANVVAFDMDRGMLSFLGEQERQLGSRTRADVEDILGELDDFAPRHMRFGTPTAEVLKLAADYYHSTFATKPTEPMIGRTITTRTFAVTSATPARTVTSDVSHSAKSGLRLGAERTITEQRKAMTPVCLRISFNDFFTSLFFRVENPAGSLALKALAEQEIFELTVRFQQIALGNVGEFRANRGKLATREKLAQQVLN
jgi:hypothetical protein